MSNKLIEKIRQSRQTQIEAGGLNLTIRYPTFSEGLATANAWSAVINLREGRGTQPDFDVILKFITDHVTGWSGVKELDLFSGGTGESVDFSRDLLEVWLKDADAEIWWGIYSEILNFANRVSEAREASIKN